MDCPGHPDFSDEATSALALVDNVLLIVDVVEGVTAYLTRLIEMTMK
jgi:translation elongation factor EF-G